MPGVVADSVLCRASSCQCHDTTVMCDNEVLTWRGVVRCVVVFVMKLETRTVEFASVTSQPHEPWRSGVCD